MNRTKRNTIACIFLILAISTLIIIVTPGRARKQHVQLFSVPRNHAQKIRDGYEAPDASIFRAYNNDMLLILGDTVLHLTPNYKLLKKTSIGNLLQTRDYDEPFATGDKDATYIIQNANSGKGISIIYISPDGVTKQQHYPSIQTRTLGSGYASHYILNGNLYVLSPEHQKDKITYTLHTIAKESLTLHSQIVELPTDQYELTHFTENRGYYYWERQWVHNGKAILAKYYSRKTDDATKYNVVLAVVEIDADGNVANLQRHSFQPEIVSDDGSVSRPTTVYNQNDHSITLAGYMELEKEKLNGLYLLNYSCNGKLNYSREYAFTDILKPNLTPEARVHYAIPYENDYTSLWEITRDDIFVNYLNNVTDLRIGVYSSRDTVTYFELSFDSNGRHLETNTASYKKSFYNGLFTRTPLAHESLWKGDTNVFRTGSVTTPWQYIREESPTGATQFFYMPIATPAANSLIEFNAARGTYTAILLP